MVLTLAAFLLRLYLNRHFGFSLPTFITLYPAVALSAILFGFWPGLLATLLGSLLTLIWVFEPIGSFAIAQVSDGVALAIFASMGVVLSWMAQRYRGAELRIAAFESQHELHALRAKLASALASMTDAVFISDKQGNFIEFNEAFVSFHRFRSKDECARTSAEYPAFLEVSTPEGELLPLEQWAVPRALRGETATNVEYTLRRKDTGETWIGNYSFSPIRDEEGAIVGSVVTGRDVTAQKQAEQRLAASETRYRTAFQTSIDAIGINHLDDERFVDVNQAFVDLSGYERREFVGRTAMELGLWAEPQVREHLLGVLRTGASCRDLKAQFRRKDGDLVSVALTASFMEIEGRPCYLAIVRDVSEATAAAEEIRTLAFFDPLTGLANRRSLMDRLRKSIAQRAGNPNRRALLFVDLDDFKTLNDTLGHQMGDLLLREVAQRITASVRKADAVGRLGGDEFVVMLDDLSEDPEEAAAEARGIAEKILTRADQTYLLEGRQCVSTCSIGITVYGGNHVDANDVLKQADIAMFQAKAAGRNTVRFFAPAQQAAVNTRAALEEDLRQAIAKSQFVLYYQPQVAFGRWTGAEALVRWNHPRRGLLLPGEFISMAEETRLILPLGDWVLETACRQLARWAEREETAGMTVAVNLSALQWRKSDFAEHVMEIVDRAGADPRRLELELTETMLVDDVEDVIAKMRRLKARGVRFSVDDFGTGYSSLAYLRRFPLDQLKIDYSFVRDILVDAGSKAIAQTVITLSKAMGLSVIAEGVETVEQRDLLAGLDCHSFQGFLFSRAVPAEEFERKLEELGN